ncbi:MAG: N-acetylmuramoyl-L-alanine amidase, partial [Chitinophagales bacterium]|nr:N-acetylmuramoyl-L-alanine amidase [Chitinophagales bacterium]
NKTREKDVALAVALLLGKKIKESFPDVKVIYTRTGDVFVPLIERANIANRSKADLFISIHCNASTNRSAIGSSTYVLGLHKTEENLEVAKRENAVIELEEDVDKNYDFNPNSPEGHIIMSMKQNAYLEQSIDIAARIEQELTGKKNDHISRGVKQAGFFVLFKTSMPALLAEIGFISNPNEEMYLASKEGQDEIAEGIFRAFSGYKNSIEKNSKFSVYNDTGKPSVSPKTAEANAEESLVEI